MHHPIASCDCPTFAVSGDRPRKDGDPSEFTLVVFPAPLPSAHGYEETKFYARLEYEVTGYFTGREIDHYEWHRLQYGTESPEPHEEQWVTWKEKHPELCVESYCVIPDLKRDRIPDVFRTPEYTAKYNKVLAEMRAAGVPFCSKR